MTWLLLVQQATWSSILGLIFVSMGSLIYLFDIGGCTCVAKRLCRALIVFFVKILLGLMEESAGLRLFTLDTPRRYSDSFEDVDRQISRRSPFESLEICDKGPGKGGDNSSSMRHMFEILEEDEEESNMCDTSEVARWRRMSTMTHINPGCLSAREQTMTEILLCNGFFACMEESIATKLYKSGSVMQLSPGDVLFDHNTTVASGMYVLLNGTIEVASHEYSSKGEGRCPIVHIFKKGEIIGEDHIDLILDVEAKWTYTSITCTVGDGPCEVLQLSQSLLCSFFSNHPIILNKYLENILFKRFSVAKAVLRDELEIQQDEGTIGVASSLLLCPKHRKVIEGLGASMTIRNTFNFNYMTDHLRDDSQLRGKGIFPGAKTSSVGSIVCMDKEASLLTGWDVIPNAKFSLQNVSKSCVRVEADKYAKIDHESCFILESGMLVAIRRVQGKEQIECALVSKGSMINPTTFMSGNSSETMFYACSDCILNRLEKRHFHSLISDCNSHDGFKPMIFLRVLTAAICPTLRQFQALGFQEEWLTAGQPAFRQNENIDGFFMVCSGNMKFLQLSPDGSIHQKGVVRRGEWGGSVMTTPSKFSCMAMRDVELVRLKKNTIPLLSKAYPHALLTIYKRIMQQKERAPEDCKPLSKTVAFIPGGTCASHSQCNCADSEVTELAEALKDSLSIYGTVCCITWTLVFENFPNEAESLHIPFARAKISSWISDMEEKYAFIMLVADSKSIEWTGLCSAQADHVLLVGSVSRSAPALSSLENTYVWKPAQKSIKTMKLNVTKRKTDSESPQMYQSRLRSISMVLSRSDNQSVGPKLHEPQRPLTHMTNVSVTSLCQIDMVLVHDSGSRPSGAKDWLDCRPLLERHYNIRRSHKGDMERVARWISGNAIGLVLSGGGARGIGHAGVLKALDKLQVPIDAIGGTSQGSFIGALHAQGHDSNSVLEKVRTYASIGSSIRTMIIDLTLPLLSVFNGKRFQQAVKDGLSEGPQNIEDLLISYYCVTSNLTTGEPRVHTKGNLWKSVRASMSIVGLVPPTIDENGHLICDGGYCDNLPVDAMRKIGASIIIAVDVEDRNFSSWSNLSMPAEGVLSGWQILWDKWCPVSSWTSGQRFPRQQHMLNALCGMAHSQNLANLARFEDDNHIDLYLRPPILQYALLDWKYIEEIVSDSTAYSIKEISKWIHGFRDTNREAIFKRQVYR